MCVLCVFVCARACACACECVRLCVCLCVRVPVFVCVFRVKQQRLEDQQADVEFEIRSLFNKPGDQKRNKACLYL